MNRLISGLFEILVFAIILTIGRNISNGEITTEYIAVRLTFFRLLCLYVNIWSGLRVS